MSGCTQVCNQGRNCTCGGSIKPVMVARIRASAPAHEAGNVRFVELEPIEPLSGRDMALVWGLLLVFGVCNLVLVAIGVGSLWSRFSAPLRALFWSLMSQWF